MRFGHLWMTVKNSYVPGEPPKAVDVTKLFEATGINVHSPLEFGFNNATYEYNPGPKANWLYYAFLAFRKLAPEFNRAELVVTVGTGSGLDAVALYETMHPLRLGAIDVNPWVVEVAGANVRKYLATVKAATEWSIVVGNLCARLYGDSADLIYGNLLTIPGEQAEILSGMNSSSFFDPSWSRGSPDVLTRNYLALQYEFLRQARVALKPGGSAVIGLGVRMAAGLVTELFHAAGFDGFESVVLDLKEQSQPEAVVTAYAKQEEFSGVEFDFYLEGAVGIRSDTSLSLEAFKTSLAKWRVSAREALALSNSGQKVYHVIGILRARK